VPKNLGDAYDGEYIWLSINEDGIHDRFLYGEKSPDNLAPGSPVDRLKVVKDRMSGIPSEPANSSERYKEIHNQLL
jgi:hypothetical protein